MVNGAHGRTPTRRLGLLVMHRLAQLLARLARAVLGVGMGIGRFCWCCGVCMLHILSPTAQILVPLPNRPHMGPRLDVDKAVAYAGRCWERSLDLFQPCTYAEILWSTGSAAPHRGVAGQWDSEKREPGGIEHKGEVHGRGTSPGVLSK
jgi:hypothetical protein